MPYFVYNVFPNKKLELIEQFSTYREARNDVHDRRKALSEDADYTVRLVHAKHETEAERLLNTDREPRPMGEEF